MTGFTVSHLFGFGMHSLTTTNIYLNMVAALSKAENLFINNTSLLY